jgi:hypothetical protein
LLKANGRFSTVPMHRLSKADLHYVDLVVANFGRGNLGNLASR